MSQVILTAFEGQLLPIGAQLVRVVATEEVPWGTGTATRRRYTLLVDDCRYWMSDEEKDARPLRVGAHRESGGES